MSPVHKSNHTPSQSELRLCYQRSRLRDWPESFDEGMKDPIRAKLVDMLARNVPAMRRNGVDRTPYSPRCVVPPPIVVPARRALDFKSLAAGEKPDLED